MNSVMNSRGPALQDRADHWARTFREMLHSEWNDSRAEDLHEQLDGLVIESDIEGETMLSSAALELSTYLCSFVDAHVSAPNPAQQLKMGQLADDLSPTTRRHPAARGPALSVVASAFGPAPAQRTSGAAADALAAAAPLTAPTLHQVWSVIRDAAVAEALGEAFVGRGIFHVHREPHATVVQSIPDSGVHCVIVDDDSLEVLLELQHRAVAAGAQAQRPTFIALLSHPGTEHRLRALRAGADHVIAHGADAATIAGRIERILANRSEEPLRVLVVDDDRSQTRFCAGILGRMGIHAVCCNDAAAALVEMRQGLPDILLVDLHMPDIDGLALTEMLLEMPGSENVAVLFLSGDDEPETRFDALSAGGDDFLGKPIQPRHLMRAVAAHGRRAQRRRRATAG
jgi:DNA-binding response OmpR family regulator